jgi:VWFA-related protein
MKTYGKAGLLGGVIAAGVAIGLAISPAAAQKPEDRPVFRTSTTAAVVDVIVRDRTGQPVPGLTQEDFEILEDGVPQRVISFESHTPGLDVARVQAGEGGRAQSPSVGDGPTQSLVALVFHNLSHQSRAMAIKAARSTIDDLAPEEYAGVFAVDLSLDTLAPFTRNKGELQDAVNQVLERAPVSLGPLSSVGVAETDGPPGTPRSPEDRQFAGIRVRLQAGLESPHQQAMQATSLSTLVTMLSRFPGRKSVILFSEGLAVSPRMDGVLPQAQDENVTFYTLDATGLSGSGRKSLPRREVDPSELTGSSRLRRASWQKAFPEMDPTAGLGPLADRTGGFIVSDTNDLTGGLSAVTADRRAFYVLAYSSRREKGDDAARHLEVRVKRQGVGVRARSGVLAAVPETP